MNKEKEMNENYEIISRVTTGTGFNTVLGYNENAIEGYKYVTWTENSRGFDVGHYFGDLQKARLDLIQRSAREFNIDLGHVYYEQFALEDIEGSLGTLVSEKDVQELMRDKTFVSLAYDRYMSIEDTNDAILDELEKIIPSKYREYEEDLDYELDDLEMEM